MTKDQSTFATILILVHPCSIVLHVPSDSLLCLRGAQGMTASKGCQR